MPVTDKFLYFLVGSSVVFISCDDLICLGVVLLTEYKGENLCFACSKFDLCLQRTACIAVEVEGVVALA